MGSRFRLRRTAAVPACAATSARDSSPRAYFAPGLRRSSAVLAVLGGGGPS
jgi:hypothetical protein